MDAVAKLQLLTGVEHEPRLVIDLRERVQPSGTLRDDQMEAMRRVVEDSRLRLQEVVSANRFRATLSGFVGLGAANSIFRGTSFSGSSGVYGLRVSLSVPLFGGPAGIQIAETRSALEQALVWQAAAKEAARLREAEYRMRQETAMRRIALLRQSVEVGRKREQSLRRLLGGGLRSASELLRAEADNTRRESDLLAAEVEGWKAAKLLARMTTSAEDAHR